MDINAIYLMKQELEKRGVINPNDVSVVSMREKGKKFSFEDHLKALIYALLTNQRKWSDVVPKLPQIDELFFNYDISKILALDGDYFERGIRQLHCGNISIKKQMKNLNKNICILISIEDEYGSLDNYVTSKDSDSIVKDIAAGKYKLYGVGPALAREYLRNVGIDDAKPDLHLKRFMGCERIGVSKNREASDAEVLKEIRQISEITELTKFDIDYIIWCYCAEGFGEICGATPKCRECVIRKYCRHI